jgi:hypothetical protein
LANINGLKYLRKWRVHTPYLHTMVIYIWISVPMRYEKCQWTCMRRVVTTNWSSLSNLLRLYSTKKKVNFLKVLLYPLFPLLDLRVNNHRECKLNSFSSYPGFTSVGQRSERLLALPSLYLAKLSDSRGKLPDEIYRGTVTIDQFSSPLLRDLLFSQTWE